MPPEPGSATTSTPLPPQQPAAQEKPATKQPAQPHQAVASGACQQPNCFGTVIDGYCDSCGAPEGAAPLKNAPNAAELEAISEAAATRSSNKISATALGTARISTAVAPKRRIISRARSAHLGEGLTTVPPVPPVDPMSALMDNPSVPENKRNCPSCEAPVGRSRDTSDGRLDGFCPKCGTKYSFAPKLDKGVLVAGQYEVQGALAHGGMGWIYLARDKNVSDRFVVLKGILNTEDKDLLASALAEQQFLAQVQHPLIVEIYNFVQHKGSGYIVMEFVPGISLKQLLKQRMAANGAAYDPLPVDQAIAFILEILPAFAYLHDNGLVYNDFKPDNLMQIGDGVKLIDLGGVRSIGDEESTLYGTVGYQAPEVATKGPSVESDLYTIGRTLLVLCSEFKGYQSTYQFTIPTPAELPLLGEYDSLYRLLLKCCAPDPHDRFTSTEELGVQLLGVLREVVASKVSGIAATSNQSQLFQPPTIGSDLFNWSQLPELKLNSSDPQYGWLTSLEIDDPSERLRALDDAPEQTVEVNLARAQCALRIGNMELLNTIQANVLSADPWEWRAVWLQGLAALAQHDVATAQSSFNAVYGQIPGELAPKLALAISCELGNELDVAETLYAICASTDANFVTPAGFGLARIRAKRQDLPGLMAALDMIPVTSRGYNEARRLKVQHLVDMGIGLADLSAAKTIVDGSRIGVEQQSRYNVTIFERALSLVHRYGAAPSLQIGGVTANEAPLRSQLVQEYRNLARLVTDPAERVTLIDKANQTKKWSIL